MPSPLTFLFPILLLLLHSPLSEAKCRPQQPLSASFCANIPVVPDFNLATYTGRWFQIYTTADARRISANRCVTANYTANPDGSIGVLNCKLTPDLPRPSCVVGEARRRSDASPAELGVSFSPGMPPGDYNVVATLGFGSYGYYAAAVFSCRVLEDRTERGFFILARTPYKPQLVLKLMKRRLRCAGFPLDDRFVRTRHPPKCDYFNGPKGFDLRPSGSMPPVQE